jgi:hypothetical protein
MPHTQVQSYNSNPISLITNHKTAIRVYSASKIPKPPKPATKALQPRIGKELEKRPSPEEDAYVSHFYHTVDKGAVPEPVEFELMVSRSANVKEKFSLLRDIEESRFCDLIVRACREPFDQGDRVTLYVTDYTENDRFYNYTPDGVQDLDTADGDMYGYTTKRRDSATSNEWVGPWGKMTMQITAWEPHATVLREDVAAGDWLQLRNVQIKTGHNGKHVEGAMREERNLVNTQRVDIAVFNIELEDKETINPRLKDAIQRWRDHLKKNKPAGASKTSGKTGKKRKSTEQQEDSGASKASKRERTGTAGTGEDEPMRVTEGRHKHTADDMGKPDKDNARGRRKRDRAEAHQRVEQQTTRFKEEILGLNPLVVCESPPDRDVAHISSLLEQQYYETTIDGDKMRVPVPFVNAKYCVNVRVVGFHPRRLEDFARPCDRRKVRRKEVFDTILSDQSDEQPTSSSEDEELGDENDARRWEWRFALLLEDALPKAKEPKRLWAVVNNMEAQLLTGVDAADLRKDEEGLTRLREKMFTLWGTLEERTHWDLAREEETMKRTPGALPPASVSDDEGATKRGRNAKAIKDLAPKVSNKPFACLIKQYGVLKKENDPALADASSTHRWQRVFGLFGTKISS